MQTCGLNFGQDGVRFVAVAIFALNAIAACKCDRADDKPYTPFGVVSSTQLGSSPSADPPAVPTVSAFTARAAIEISPPKPEVEVEGRTLTAPAGLGFSKALAVAADDAPLVFAWLVPLQPDAASPPGSLWAFETQAAPRKLRDYPGFVPTLEGCKQSTNLQQSGPHSLALDVSAHCSERGIPRAPTRSLEVFTWPRAKTLLELRLALDPRSGFPAVRVDSTDQDGDGHDDVRVGLGVRSRGGEGAEVQLSFVDRTAGAARDFSEPAKSFSRLAESALQLSRSSSGSGAALTRVEQFRRLFALVCAEGQSPHVTDAAGKPLGCGDLNLAAANAARSEVFALLAIGDVARAVAAFERGDWYEPARAPAVRDELKDAIYRATKRRKAQVQRLALHASERGPGPRLSPLGFDVGGHLLIQTPGGVLRVVDGTAVDASEEVDPWPLVLTARDGRYVTSLSYPCDSLEVQVLAQDRSGRQSTALVTDLLSPRPGACTGEARFFEPELVAAAWGATGPSVYVGPVLYGPALGAGILGGPLSANGRWQVSSTQLGLLVQERTETRAAPASYSLWEADGLAALDECVIDNQASQIACLDGAQVVLITAP
jgi:hypothetical protein